MKIGFTGTRNGMTDLQNLTLRWMLSEFKSSDEVHHGDCVGADDQFHDAAGRINARRVLHPPINGAYRAGNIFFDECREPKEYHARNRDIVDETDLLIAAPKESAGCIKGGTWYTIRYALKVGKQVRIIWPDGTVKQHAPKAKVQV